MRLRRGTMGGHGRVSVYSGLRVRRACVAQTFTVIHNFAAGQDGSQPVSGLTKDKAGNFYGTASAGGAGYGTVFKLTHKNPTWILSPLYSFMGGNNGAGPVATMVVGPNGTLYGSTRPEAEGRAARSTSTAAAARFSI